MEALQGKVAYITGGSKGIGYGVARMLLAQGMKVGITSRTLSAAEKAAKSLTDDPAQILGLESDVTVGDTEKNAVASLMKKFGQLDVLIANAGVGHFASIEDLTESEWKQTIDTNLTGVFNSVKACIPHLKKSRGTIITIASLAGTNFFPKGSAYNASKFGLVGFTQAVMLDVRQYGIKVTTIMPGSVSTHFNDHVPGEEDAWKIQPDDIGEIVVDLLKMPARTLPSKIEVRPTIPR